MQQYEFHIYAGNDDGVVAERAQVQTLPFRSDSAARSRAGQLAKKNKGPVDLAFAGAADWTERYMTTANPSKYHTSGYRCERLT